ncbi:MAG: hypothetical protein SNF73_03345 [Rikenellaceae bacterium]
MDNRLITIDDCGMINVPKNVQMMDFEIAQLLGVMLPTVRGCIKRLLKSRMILDCSGGEVHGNKIIPTHFGLDVVIAIAFQVESYQADLFRKWVIRRMAQRSQVPIYIDCKSTSDIKHIN